MHIVNNAKKQLNKNQRNYLEVSFTGKSNSGINNEGFWGINVVQGRTYKLSFWAKGKINSHLKAYLACECGKKVLASADIKEKITGNWKKYSVELTATANNENARLWITSEGKGTVDFDVVSLFPPTYNNRENGMRPDLASMLKALHPKFFRFPGGCFVEGQNSPVNAFHWESSIGPIEQRPGHWNVNWGYRTTDGIGFDEYLQLAEDLGAIRLLPSRLTLKEVTVKSRQKIHKIDNDVFIPTAFQKKVSLDGYDLLRNMAIPQLDIDAITNETTVKGKAVTFIVDNHIVTNPNDIKQLSPNDILKVEYDAMPTGEYAQYDCIVKFTTKRKDRGGNLMVSGMQGPNKNEGDVNGVVRFYKQRYEHSVAYAEAHSHDDDSYTAQTEHLVYPNGDELEKALTSNASSQKKRSSKLFYNLHY